MATRINPCFGCPLRKDCEQREIFRKKAQRLGARSVSFDCPILHREIQPGRRVVVRAYVANEDWTSEYAMHPVDVVATITSVAAGHRFACTVDADQGIEDKYRFRRKQAHTRIISLVDERRLVCAQGNVQTPGGICDNKGGCYCREPAFTLASFVQPSAVM